MDTSYPNMALFGTSMKLRDLRKQLAEARPGDKAVLEAEIRVYTKRADNLRLEIRRQEKRKWGF